MRRDEERMLELASSARRASCRSIPRKNWVKTGGNTRGGVPARHDWGPPSPNTADTQISWATSRHAYFPVDVSGKDVPLRSSAMFVHLAQVGALAVRAEGSIPGYAAADLLDRAIVIAGCAAPPPR